MTMTLTFILLGYLSGSLLFAELYSILFKTEDITQLPDDHNPGVANAFAYGGFAWGVFTLLGDLAKGMIPVWLYCRMASPQAMYWGLPFVLLAPVVGHIFPVYFHFHGGKGIAVTFGVYLGLWAGLYYWQPAISLAALFLFFVLILPVHPNLYLTGLVYCMEPVICSMLHLPIHILWGIFLISACVLLRLILSKEPRPRLEVRFLWKR